MTICIFLALQEFEDGRVMFRRFAYDGETGFDVSPVPGGAFQKQTLSAFQWLHAAGLPVAHDGEVNTTTVPMQITNPFEVIHDPSPLPTAQH